jgi:thioester reductase-like protein
VAIFLTGSTGYIGAHVGANLLDGPWRLAERAGARARSAGSATAPVAALQLHLDFPRFYEYLQTRVRIFAAI